MRIPALLATALAIVFSFACGGSDGSDNAVANAGLPVIDIAYEGGVLHAEVASTAEQRAAGLSNRDHLDEDAGMLFDLGDEYTPQFWMKDMRFALDMLWILEDGTVAEITADIQPQPGADYGDLIWYRPNVPVRYVLELNAGASARLGIDPGDRLAFELPPAPDA
jgi:uncharacterized membrane protein (UPF0127 family)